MCCSSARSFAVMPETLLASSIISAGPISGTSKLLAPPATRRAADEMASSGRTMSRVSAM
jgi:hypothetical protein